MNFFEHQDRARKKTGRLIVLFVLAVISILVALNLAAFGVMQLLSPQMSYVRDAAPVIREDHRYPGTLTPVAPIWQMPHIYGLVTAGTLIVVLGGSLYKTAALSRGGATLAQSLGGRPLRADAASANPQDRVLQNVVEEMSIASGMPVPDVYVMENEPSINAFAAGFTTEDAVIGVTRGCIDKLNRDELQGVVAHEFSHILNGDMRLNLRLIGVLHGILVIALLGYGLLRSLAYVRTSGRRSSKGNGGQIVLLIAISGGAMLVIGYVGVFFGRLIQSAVSRQREFLADASAVQFTRNPKGIAGALMKIAATGFDSRIEHHNAVEAAHMFFGSAIGSSFTRLLATHPPIEQRIKAIDPMWDGRLTPAAIRAVAPQVAPQAAPGTMGFAGSRVAVQPQQVAQRAGSIAPDQVRYATALVASIPDAVRAAAREPFGARAVVFALLLSDDARVRARQLERVRQNVELAAHRLTQDVAETIAPMGARAQLPLLDLAMPALRQLSATQLAQFKAVVRALIAADERVSLFEYALARILDHHVRAPDAPAPRHAVKYYALSAVMDDAARVLSALAAASSRDTASAYAAGAVRLNPQRPPAMASFTNLAELDSSLKRLADASGAVKQRVIDAAAHVVAADGQVEVAEAELLRAIAATVDVPLPPLVSELDFRAIDDAVSAATQRAEHAD